MKPTKKAAGARQSFLKSIAAPVREISPDAQRAQSLWALWRTSRTDADRRFEAALPPGVKSIGAKLNCGALK